MIVFLPRKREEKKSDLSSPESELRTLKTEHDTFQAKRLFH